MNIANKIASALVTVALTYTGTTMAAVGTIPAESAAKEQGQLRLGLAAMMRSTAYRDFDDEVMPVPLIIYTSKKFYWQISQGGFNFINNRNHQLSAIVEIGPDEWDKGDLEDDSPLNTDLLEDRDRSFNAGVQYTFRGRWGAVKFKALTDVSDTHEGNYGDISYTYPWRVTNEIALVGTVGVSLLDSDYTTYYYGIPEDQAGGSTAGELDDASRAYVSLLATYNLTKKWQLLGLLKATALDSELEDSIFTDDDIESAFALGFTYKL